MASTVRSREEYPSRTGPLIFLDNLGRGRSLSLRSPKCIEDVRRRWGYALSCPNPDLFVDLKMSFSAPIFRPGL